MRITNLTIENFRSFGKRQTIPFAPLTLLFGPNSVGKSSVLMALFYVQQILAKGQCDPQRIEAMGNRFVGGFRHLVRGKTLDQPLRIAVEFEIGEGELGRSYSDLGELVTADIGTIGELTGFANFPKRMRVDFEICWSGQREQAFVSKYTVSFDRDIIAEVTSDPGLEQPMVTAMHYHHLSFYHDAFRDWVLSSAEQTGHVHPVLQYFVENEDDPEALNPQNPHPYEFSEETYHGDFHEFVKIPPLKTSDPENEQLPNAELDYHVVQHANSRPLGIKGFAGALPRLGQLLHAQLPVDDDLSQRVGLEVLSDILVAPLDNLLKILNQSLCIGPLRHIVDSTYKASAYPSQSDWYSGRASWDTLSLINPKRDFILNHWLSDENKLNLGYSLVYKNSTLENEFFPVRRISGKENVEQGFRSLKMIRADMERKLRDKKTEQKNHVTASIDKMEDIWEKCADLIEDTDPTLFSSSNSAMSISIWDNHNEVDVAASDIGVGVSQLLPLVVASFKDDKASLIACEQPELHVHPRVQVAIADMLLSATGKNFLIETHSEHLVLRLLRRIRETTEVRLPDDMAPVSPDRVAIVYLESEDEGVSVSQIEIDEDGEFKQRWPHGFFPERREELL